MSHQIRFSEKFIFLFLGLLMPTLAVAAEIKPTLVNAEYIRQEKINLTGGFIKAVRFSDVSGEHLLLLTKASTPSKSKPNPQKIERHELKAINFRKTAEGWVQEWVINDYVDCPDLDSEADFFLDSISVTDVNNDGFAEASVPYSLFCGGGIDSKIIKIIMRTKSEKFAIRGESRVILPGQEPFGGAMTVDPALHKNKNTAYKNQLIKLWNCVSTERR